MGAVRRSKYGDDVARQYAMMNETGLKYIEYLVKELDIPCAFEKYRSVTYTRVCGA